MTSAGGGRNARPAHVGEHGYDVKFAMHALRLGLQGIELLRYGRVTLPIPEPSLSELRAVRSDQRPLDEVLARLADLENQLQTLGQANDLPEQPDWHWINDWLHRSYTEYWSRGAST